MLIQGKKDSKQAKKFRGFIWNTLDWIYPPLCCSCGRIGSDICSDCLSLIDKFLPDPLCRICGPDVNAEQICISCSRQNPGYDRIRSWGVYSGILKILIQEYKFNHHIKLADCIINQLLDCIAEWNPSVDLIVPVALSKQRMRTRGYNQSAIIAKMVAEEFGIEYSGKAVIRRKNTRPQVGLSAKERRLNVVDAFFSEASAIQGKNILLVDDIITTGATINECTKAIKNAGANKVYVFTIARTIN